MSTQFSFGRAAAAIGNRVRATPGLLARWSEWKEQRQRERERQQIIEKHVKQCRQGTRAGDRDHARPRPPSASRPRARAAPPTIADDDDDDEIEERPRPGRQAAPSIRGAQPRRLCAQPLPLADAVASQNAGRAPAGRLHAAAGHAVRRAERPPQDRRARADGCRAASRGEVPRVLGRGHRRPDSSGPGRHDLRVQAGCRREVQPHHGAGR